MKKKFRCEKVNLLRQPSSDISIELTTCWFVPQAALAISMENAFAWLASFLNVVAH